MAAMDPPGSKRASSSLTGAEFVRRRRGRNYALLAVLVALAVLFYAITIVQRTGVQ
jgi:hypothetical protein